MSKIIFYYLKNFILMLFLVTISNQVAEIDPEARKALNLIKTGKNEVVGA
jgi:hypothetical protein